MVCQVFTGAPSSGKSMAAERWLAQEASSSPLLYIGTLPDIARYRARILQHRKRRDSSWVTIEEPRLPIKLLQRAVETCNLHLAGGVLLDGLGAYLSRRLLVALRSGGSLDEEVKAFHQDFHGMLRALDVESTALGIVTSMQKRIRTNLDLQSNSSEQRELNARVQAGIERALGDISEHVEAFWWFEGGLGRRVSWDALRRFFG